MNNQANPLEYILNSCEKGLIPSKFDILNAKDELNKMRQQLTYFQNNESYTTVAWARINDRGDLYDPRLQLNPFFDEKTIVPLYANKKELKKWLDKSR